MSENVESNAVLRDTKYDGDIFPANYSGTSGYWAFRSAINASYNLDLYNQGDPLTAITILQDGNNGIGTIGTVLINSLLAAHAR